MLQALDETLKNLLENEIPKNIPKNIVRDGPDDGWEVNFKTPYEDTIGEKTAINLFLYDVQENLDLRNRNWTFERTNNSAKAVKKLLPARVDCSYLINVWLKEDDPAQEHELLGEVMKLLLRHSTIDKSYISDELEGQDLPLRLGGLRPSGLQSFGEFWQAMGGKKGTKPKVVLHCTVTISVPVDEAEKEEVGLLGVYQPSSQ